MFDAEAAPAALDERLAMLLDADAYRALTEIK